MKQRGESSYKSFTTSRGWDSRRPKDSRDSGRRNFRGRDKRTNSGDTSWQGVAGWYNDLVGEKGQYYHQNVIFPKALKLLDIKGRASVLDLGCGQGVFGRALPEGTEYFGVDLSRSLIDFAKRHARGRERFAVADITKPLDLEKRDFTHASIILALQNVEDIEAVARNAAKHLGEGGRFLIVLNHPAFRIPRQSSWEIDESNKMQYRRVNRYYQPLKIPVDMNPGERREQHAMTWSFHYPLERYIKALKLAGFMVEDLEEWVSDKSSQGRAARMENRSREEFPLFMAILAVKR